MKSRVLASVLLGAVPLALGAPASDYLSQYSGIKVLRLPTTSAASVNDLGALIESLGLSRWTSGPVENSHIDVEVPEAKYAAFMEEVDSTNKVHGIDYPVVVMHEDLAESIKLEQEGMYGVLDKRAGLAVDAWFNAYHPYNDHLTFLDDLVATYPANARIVNSGSSLQGRPIKGINIFGSGGAESRPAIIVHGTVHAREWISTMTTEHFAYSLLANYSTSTTVKSYIDKYDFYFFPIVNPDGFVFTQTTQRLWRKNRSLPPRGSTCYGTDINRNWPHKSWSQSGGASTSACSETYKGTAAASEAETKGLFNFIAARANSTVGAQMYLDVHSYSQLFMGPYGYSCSVQAANAAELKALEDGYGKALAGVYGTSMVTGPSCPTLYQVSGGSVDWNYDDAKIKYSFITELRDTGTYGFVLPANQIRPVGIENYAGLLYLLGNMK